jgi:hypothetical protein
MRARARSRSARLFELEDFGASETVEHHREQIGKR